MNTTENTTTRTQDQIVSKIREWIPKDFLGFKVNDLLVCLDWEHAKQFLKPEAEQEWKIEPCDRESILKKMRDYMPFAWEKANGERGISAGRSMCHFTAWTWLIGDEDKFADLEEYEFYGKDNLLKLCHHYGWTDEDNGVRSNG